MLRNGSLGHATDTLQHITFWKLFNGNVQMMVNVSNHVKNVMKKSSSLRTKRLLKKSGMREDLLRKSQLERRATAAGHTDNSVN